MIQHIVICSTILFQVEFKQVVMSHSPLQLFRQFCSKHVLVSGQGPVKDIARNLGFTKVTTIEELRNSFPNLDMVDHKRRQMAVNTSCNFHLIVVQRYYHTRHLVYLVALAVMPYIFHVLALWIWKILP